MKYQTTFFTLMYSLSEAAALSLCLPLGGVGAGVDRRKTLERNNLLLLFFFDSLFILFGPPEYLKNFLLQFRNQYFYCVGFLQGFCYR